MKWTKSSAPNLLRCLVITLFVLTGCSDETEPGDGGGDPQTCPTGQRLSDGVCVSAGRDVGQTTNQPDLGVEPDLTAEGDTDVTQDDTGVEGDTGTCEEGTRTCLGDDTSQVCDGGELVTFVCEETQTCVSGVCTSNNGFCTPGETLGCAGPTDYRICNEAADGAETIPCPVETPNCLGSGECSDRECLEGDTRCNIDLTGVEVCGIDGMSWEAGEACMGGLACQGGDCLSPCEENAKQASFLGCDYFAVDLDQHPQAVDQQFSISISNPNEDPVTVTVTNMATNVSLPEEIVEPGTVGVIDLPRLDLEGVAITRNAYHIVTDLPVTAHQFNPANNEGVASNDASLLLPSNGVGMDYYVLGWPTIKEGLAVSYSYATIVAVTPDETTTVRITPTAEVPVSATVNRMRPNVEALAVLEYGDVLNLETIDQNGADLTGTHITADQPIAVFVGHECANVPDINTDYCDHIEQQLIPVEASGTRYFGGKFSPRGTEVDVYRIVAAEDTTLTTDPVIAGANGETLQAGRALQFITDQTFQIVGTGRFLMGQYMVGSNYSGIPNDCGLTGLGDPAFVLATPLNQFRDNYIFLTPSRYEEDYFTAIAPVGTTLTYDGVALPENGFVPIGSSGYAVYTLSTDEDPGQVLSEIPLVHTLGGDNPFSLTVYGYDCDVSYAYPGGLNLEVEEQAPE